MNIGINASFLRKPYTGIGQVTTHVLNEIIERAQNDKSMKNHKFFVYCEETYNTNLPKNFYKRSFLPRFYKRDDLFRKLLWEKFWLPRRARQDSCDVLLSLYQSATVIKYTDMKHAMIVHDVIPHIFPEYLNNLRKKFYWQRVEFGMYSATNLITVSEHTKIDLETKLNIKSARITVDPISVDPIFHKDISDEKMMSILKKYQLQRGYIYTGGGLEVRKDVERTLRAYKLMRERWKGAPDLVVSGTLMPQLAPLITDVEKIVRDLGIENYVKILGFVPQEDLPSLYKGASIFLFPSRYEGFGMPVLEAMSVGTPVLTAKNSSLEEVGGNAVEYTEHDDEKMCQKMMKLLQNSEQLERMSVNGMERSKEFSWDKFITNLCDILCK